MTAYTGGMDKIMNAAIGFSADEFVQELKTGKDSANLNLTTNEAVDKLAEIIYTKFGSTLEESAKGKGASGEIAYLFLRITKSAGISYGLKEGIKKILDDELGLDEGTSKELMAVKFKTLLDKGLFTTIMNVQVDRFFHGMFKSLYMLFGMILLFPVLETVIANIIYRRKLKNATIK
jgi:hypothetical protein